MKKFNLPSIKYLVELSDCKSPLLWAQWQIKLLKFKSMERLTNNAEKRCARGSKTSLLNKWVLRSRILLYLVVMWFWFPLSNQCRCMCKYDFLESSISLDSLRIERNCLKQPTKMWWFYVSELRRLGCDSQPISNQLSWKMVLCEFLLIYKAHRTPCENKNCHCQILTPRNEAVTDLLN